MKKILFVLFLNFVSMIAFSQQTKDAAKYISFKFYHSMRIPYSEVSIEIFRKKDSALVKVNSKAADDDKEWDYSRIKNEFNIDLKTFEELSLKIVELQTKHIETEVGFDGNTCIIELKKGNEKFKYNVWTPEYDTSERGLNYYLDICYEIILLGKLEPKEIFRQKGT